MELEPLKVILREGRGKGPARRKRMTGAIPGVMYGGDGVTHSIEIDYRTFVKMRQKHKGEHAVVQLEVEGQPELNCPALLKAVQYHPVKSKTMHVDFLRVRLDEYITTNVPLVLKGLAPGVVMGGLLDQQLRYLEVECLPLDVPEQLEADVSGLNLGDSLHVRDVQSPPNVKILTNPARPIGAVHTSRIARVAAPGEAAVEGEEEGEEGSE